MQAFLDIFDIYLLEAVVNGILLGGVLALLALGLNLIFGVIDVTWICYAELVMIGMYGMYYMVQVFGFPYYVAAPLTIVLVAGLGALLHLLVMRFAEMHFSYSRLLAFAAALIGMLLVFFFMKKTYVGTAIRAIAQDRQ